VLGGVPATVHFYSNIKDHNKAEMFYKNDQNAPKITAEGHS
jgi:hypothetical protein